MANLYTLFNSGQLGNYPDYYYESRLKKYKSESFYSELMADLKITEGLITDTEIKLNDDVLISEVKKKEVLKNFGKPCHSVSIKNPLKTEILFYRKKIANHKIKIEFHFFKRRLIFFIYNFSNLKDITEVTQIIKEKYLAGDKESLLNKKIVDKNNSTILVRNNLDLEIYYLCNNRLYLEIINAIKDREDTQGTRHKKDLYKRL
jgi:hypothetical protein